MIKYLSLNIAIEVVTCLIAFFCLYNDKRLAWRLIPFFMAFTCIVEITGRWLHINKKSNDWVYNVYLIAEASVITAMYRYSIKKYTQKIKFIGAGGLILILLYSYEIIVHGILSYNDDTETAMLGLFICYGLYYYYLLMDNEVYHKLYTYPPFWWVAGTLFFCFGSIVSDLYYTFLNAKAWPLFTSRYSIFNYLNIILYGFWTYSFICRYHQRKSIA
jgi:hypothetical protein